MIWLEMSRDADHGGGEWGFKKCLWSPTRKVNRHKWSFWETVGSVETGDTVLHLRGRPPNAYFVGFSTAASDGYITTEHPPKPGAWAYSSSFYRVDLKDFIDFSEPINLNHVFRQREQELRDYFVRNRSMPKRSKERLFYVIQSGRLQCQNGAYLSEVSAELLDLLLHNLVYDFPTPTRRVIREVSTGERISELRTRIGHKDFSDAVKSNFAMKCCFPGCEISEKSFLVSGHIARWSDESSLRGATSNGLCLCLMHDKAFEHGLFTLDSSLAVWSTMERLSKSEWGAINIEPYIGERIKAHKIAVSLEALKLHWKRINLHPA